MLMILVGFIAKAQSADNVYTSIGMPGDNLNLSLVLDIFKQATSIQDFERRLNDPDTRVNNLDLNNDGTIDYLKVTDYGKNNYHTIIIQDIVSAYETQDVAIIDIEKNNGNLVHVQIIGDESLYGKNYIIEPQIETAQKYQQNNQPTTVINNNYYGNQNPTQYVNAWGWPCVNIIFSNAYSPWVSPWHWAYYPTWWNPRPRVIYNVYYSYHNGFGWNNYCHRNYYVNQKQYHNYYQNRRVTSKVVQVNVTKNVYKNNMGKNTNNAPRGNSYNNTNQNNPGNNGNNPGKWNNGNVKNNTGKPNAGKNEQNVNNQNQPRNNNPKWSGNSSDNNNTNNNGTTTNSPKWKNNNTGNQNSGSQNGGQWSNPNKPTKSTTTPTGNKGNANNNGGFNNNSNGSGGVKIGKKAK